MRRVFGLLILMLMPLLPVAAQHALSVDVIIGFSGVFRAGTWTPIHVTVQNLGEAVDGTLAVEVERGDRFGPNRYALRYSREVELVSGASKAFSFVIPLETSVYPITIRVSDGKTVAHEEEYDLLGRSVPARLTLVLARRPNLDFLLPLYNSRDERVLDIVYPLPTYLPDQWQGYEAVDTIVIHDARLQELTTEQVLALRGWVAAGGRLVISGGSHFGPADAQTLEPLGDFRTDGVTTTRVEDAGFLEQGLPIDPDERGREVVATSFVEHGTRIVREPVGRGDVVLLPVDYANLVRVAPLTSVGLWNSLLSHRTDREAVATEADRRVFETDILANQLSLPLYDFPSRLLVLGLAVSFIVGLGAILFWLARGRDRLRRWLGLPAIAGILLTVALTGHLALTVTLQPVEALALSVERAEIPPEGGYAFVTRETALFSRQRADYEISYAGTPALIPMENRDHEVVQRPDRAGQQLTVSRWSYANNVAFQVAELDVRPHVQNGSGYVDVELINNSSQAIRHLVLLRNGFPERMGQLPANRVMEHVAGGLSARDFQAIDWTRYVADDELAENRARLLGDIARSQRFNDEDAPELIVVGWPERPLLPVLLEPSFEQTVDLHVLTIPMYLQRGDS